MSRLENEALIKILTCQMTTKLRFTVKLILSELEINLTWSPCSLSFKWFYTIAISILLYEKYTLSDNLVHRSINRAEYAFDYNIVPE